MEIRPMRSWIHHRRGEVLRQGGVGRSAMPGVYEDMLTRHGFEGRDAYLYRRHESTAWKRAEGAGIHLDLDGRLLEPTDLTDAGGNPLRLFYNPDGAVSVSRRSANMTYSARNADGDELYFVHKGTGTFYTEFGPIPYEPGDYVLLPKGVTYRIRPTGPDNYFMIIETTEELGFADIGPHGRRAPFDPGLLYVPSPELDDLGDGRNQDGEWPVRVKYQGGFTTAYYDFDPIDAIGWSGDLFPFKLNIRDFRPITSDRIHIMPSGHAVFATSTVVVGNYLPRPLESAPDAEPFPPIHRNMDYDEFLFTHAGTALGVPMPPASFALTPRGLHHGLPAKVEEELRKGIKPGTVADFEFIFVDWAHSLVATPEALAQKRAGDQLREGVAAQ
ncbi:homogentisate 1,2-dioxygenase [Planotetraspora sp. A-T 1434]|uniref:homogentisate 1,2-dioxygenase n=1 Tax=Planotetraspora sp. A-T 1434 TaxID=2979219 RepID=UPI0021C0CFAD|nr:homogentisate 1,2-dioxygenase [Planotetraspora sp. A-T 1434]MCT9932184.1 homogentisate 1,2-dioxygenase [Planotetraspora sp. A-T 1434]